MPCKYGCDLIQLVTKVCMPGSQHANGPDCLLKVRTTYSLLATCKQEVQMRVCECACVTAQCWVRLCKGCQFCSRNFFFVNIQLRKGFTVLSVTLMTPAKDPTTPNSVTPVCTLALPHYPQMSYCDTRCRKWGGRIPTFFCPFFLFCRAFFNFLCLECFCLYFGKKLCQLFSPSYM